jgi:hypothetical protein
MQTLSRWCVGAFVALCGCRDLNLPPAPGNAPGAVTGRIVWQRPGRFTATPASGAGVFLLESNLSVAASADGRFVLEGITSTRGTLLIRFDADGNGSVDHQRALSLAELGAGRGRTVSAGEIQLSAPSAVSGQAVLADQPGGDASGTSVFIPGLPLGSLTAADGQFLLEGMVEGPVQVAAARSGYVPFLGAPVELRGGEELRVSRITLRPDTQPMTAAVQGRVVDLGGAPLGGAAVTLGTFRLAATTNTNGEFTFGTVPTGRYDLRITAPGRAPLALFNLLVVGGADLALPELVLAPGTPAGPVLVDQVDAETDAGMPAFTLELVAPSAPLVLTQNQPVGVHVLSYNPDVLASGATVQWSASPAGALLFDDPLAQYVQVTGALVGPFRLEVEVTFQGTTVRQLVTGRVDAPGAQVLDAGATALAAWVDVGTDFVGANMAVLIDGGAVNPVVLADPLRRRVVALFEKPTLPGFPLSLRPALFLSDGGSQTLGTVDLVTAGFSFSAPVAVLDGGNTPPVVGAGVLPEGFVVTAALGDAAPICNNFSCFAWALPGGAEGADTSGMPPLFPYDGKRVVVAGQTAQAWYGPLRSMGWDGSRFADVAMVPPGPTFADGPTLTAVTVGDAGIQLHAWNGARWQAQPSQAAGTNLVKAVIASSPAPGMGPGTDLWAVTVQGNGNVDVFRRPSGFMNWGQLTGPLIAQVQGARVVATRSGAAFVVTRATGQPALFTTSTSAVRSEHTLGGLVPLDLVAIGTSAYLLCVDFNSQLILKHVDIQADTLADIILPQTNNVRDGELAAGDFGELGIARSSETAAFEYSIAFMKLVP